MPGVIVGKHMLYDVTLVVNSVTLSDHCEKIEWEAHTDDFRGDAMGDTSKYKMAGLLEVPDIKATFFQDYNTAKVYATLYAAWSVPQTYFTVVAKASSAARSPTNPEFTVTCFVKSMPIIKGEHGARHMADVVFGVASVMSVAVA